MKADLRPQVLPGGRSPWEAAMGGDDVTGRRVNAGFLRNRPTSALRQYDCPKKIKRYKRANQDVLFDLDEIDRFL